MDDRRHNGGPPLEEEAKPFNKRKWAAALLTHPKKPAGVVAMAFKLYMEMDATGHGAAVSDADFVVSCGVSDRSARSFKRWLLDNGFVEIKTKGNRGRGTEFIARIPGSEIAATIAGVMDQIPAGNTGTLMVEYRQSFPAIEEELPAIPAVSTEPAAPVAGDPVQPSRARGEYNNIYNTNTNLDSEFGDRGCGGKTLFDVTGSKPAEPPSLDAGGSVVVDLLKQLVEQTIKPKAKRQKRTPDPNQPSPAEVEEAFSLYNEMAARCGLSQASVLNDERKDRIGDRMREHGGMAAWKQALANIERSAHLQGRNKDAWKADLDFLIRPSRFTKVWEGGWGNGAHPPDQPEETLQQRARREMAEIAASLSAEKRNGH